MSATRVRESLVRETEKVRRLSSPLAMLPERKPFGQVIYDRRLELGLRQLDVARAAGLNDTMIGKIEAGERTPDINHLPAIARLLRIDLAAFTRAFLRQRAPKIHQALGPASPLEKKLYSLPAPLRSVILQTIDRLVEEERKERLAALSA